MKFDKSHRVLMLLENGGIPEDHRVFREAESLLAAGSPVTVICPTYGRQRLCETIHGVSIYRFPAPFSPKGTLGYVWEYGYSLTFFFLISFYVLFRRGFDVIHVHTPPDLTAVVAVFYQLLGKKFVFDHHDLSPELYLARRSDDTPDFVYQLLCFFERLACRRADRLIATNQTQQQIQQQRCGANAERCFIVRNGPDKSFTPGVNPRDELRAAGQILLGYVGVIGIQDGVDYMVKVLHELKFNRQRNDFKAIIVGDGSALGDLKDLAEKLQVSEQILFIGRVPFCSVPSYIASFDICLTPDPSNPYNDSCTTIKTMEYMAMGKPTVCFRTAENEVTAGDSALYADGNSVSAFAELIEKLMDDRSLRITLGEIGRQRIEAEFSWDKQVVELFRLYNEL